MNEKNILVISNMYPSHSDPTYGTFVKKFVENVNGFEVILSVIRGRHRFPRIVLEYIAFYVSIMWKYIIGDFELVYVHYILHPSLLLYPLSLLRNKHPVILHVHGCDILPNGKIKRIMFWFARKMANAATTVVVPSEYYKTLAANQLGIPVEKIMVWASSGIDEAIFSPMSNDQARSRDSLKLICVSRLDKNKGIDVLLRAVKKLSNLSSRVISLDLVGFGTRSEIECVKKMITDLEIGNIVNYRGSKVHEEIAELLRGSDLFVFPTFGESLGLSALEAMACGIPVVGSHVTALPEYIINDKTGYLFEVGNSDDLVKKILCWLNLNEVQKSSMAKNCVAMAAKYYSGSLANQMNEILTQMLSQGCAQSVRSIHN